MALSHFLTFHRSLQGTLRIFVAFVICVSFIVLPSTVSAGLSLQTDDPVAECAQGWGLYLDDQYRDALPHLEAGYQNRDRVTFANPQDLGNCAMALGIVYQHFSQSDKALLAETFALEIFEENNIPRGIATTLGELGRAYFALGQYDSALDHYQRSIDVWETIGDQKFVGRILQAMAQVYGAQGQYAKALDLLQRSLAIARAVNDRAGEGTTLADIGVIYDHQGRSQEALDYLQQALIVQREVSDSVGEAKTLNNIATIYEDNGRTDEAIENYQQALELLQQLADRASEAVVFSNLGRIYGSKGDSADALESYQQALVIQQDIGDRTGEGTTLNNIGVIYHSQEQYTEALEYYQRALQIMQEIGGREGEARTLNNIGMLHQSEGNLPEAVATLEKAIEVFELLRASAGNEVARAAYIAQYSNLYDVATTIYFQLEQYDKSFYITERARARAFLDSLASGQVKLSDDQDATLYVQEQETYAALLAAQESLSKAKSQDQPDEKLVSQRETELTQAEEEHQVVLKTIVARDNPLSQLIAGTTNLVDVPQTQALLSDDTTLLSFWLIDDSVLVFILTRESFVARSMVIDPAALSAKIQAFRNFDTIATPHPQSSVELYNTLIAPIKSYLRTSRLIIIPQGHLHYLPFSALTDGQRYLIDDYVITYLPSASTLPFIMESGQETSGEPLIIGNPETGNSIATPPAPLQRGEFGPLPFAEQEAKDIASELGVSAYISTDATETLIKQLAGQTKILHLAAHGRFNPDIPLDSLIALAPDGENDGWLTVGEVYSLDLHNNSLVVLSACETQMGLLTAGEEFIGLTRAFFFAGTPTVAASLWNVDDKSTALLMGRFYAHLLEGMGKAEALKLAQIEVREQYPNPYYWAAFVLNGDAGVVTDIRPIRATDIPVPTHSSTSQPTGIPNCGIGTLSILFPTALFWLSKRRVRLPYSYRHK